MTRLLGPGQVGEAVAELAAGQLVAIPTETVYGLAARADSPEAVRAVFAAKGRPADHPLIVHVADLDTARRWADMTPEAESLVRRFWPGSVTLLLRRREPVCDEITGGRDTVAVRMPDHPLALRVISELGCPVVAPSANRFGKVSPTTAAHVVADLGGDIAAVLDGGPCTVGVESTIVDCTGEAPQILRPGAVTAEEIAGCLGRVVEAVSGPSRAPGMLEAHYAPRARVLCAETREQAESLVATEAAARRRVRLLADDGDPRDFARRLYDDLRRADADGIETVVALLPADEGIGSAIRDRLRKAAAGSVIRR